MRPLSLIISCLLLIVGVLPSHAQLLTPLNAPPPPPLDYLAEGASACFVYPITFHKKNLENITPMPDPNAPLAEVPSSSTITLYRYSSSGQSMFRWSRWRTFPTATEFARSFTSGGTLGEGFTERIPLSGYYSGAFSNTLEINDWIPELYANPNSVAPQLDFHIANKTIMIMPIHDVVYGTGAGTDFRVSGFIKVRLLAYGFNGPSAYLKFGLVANDVQYACFKSQTKQSTVQFSNTMPLSDVVQLHWDFGDGISTTGISPTHRYDSTGTFTVTLSITDTLNRPSYAYGRVNITELTPISRTLFLPLIQHYGVNGVPEGTP